MYFVLYCPYNCKFHQNNYILMPPCHAVSPWSLHLPVVEHEIMTPTINRSFLGILKSSSIFMILFQYSFNFLVVMIFHCYYAPHHLECISRKQKRDFQMKYVGWCDMRTHPCNAFLAAKAAQ